MPLKKLTELINDEDSSINTNQIPGAGSLFGSAQPANASTPKPGSLFGAPSTASQQSQQPPSLFASSSTTAATQPQQPSIFASAASAQPQQQTGSLFGAPAQSQTPSRPQTQTTGSLFGNTNATSQANTGATNGPSLFGGNATGTAEQRPSFLSVYALASTSPHSLQILTHDLVALVLVNRRRHNSPVSLANPNSNRTSSNRASNLPWALAAVSALA